MVNWFSIIISGMITFAVLIVLLRTNLFSSALDQPNHRSLHVVPVPRSGGLAIMSGIFVAFCMDWLPKEALIVGLSLLLVTISFFDDLHGLSIGWRFLSHFIAAIMFVAIFLTHGVSLIGLTVMVFAIVWVTNLFNFMDGSDGLAGGMALFGFGFYGIAAWGQGDAVFAGFNGCVAASALVFLCFNFYPARIFMGDVGSIPLGFLAATFGLFGWHQGLWPLWFPGLVFSPFIVDASVTLIKRIIHKEKIWQAHRSHYYQRLILMGFGHRKTALLEYVLMLAIGLSAVLLIQRPFQFQLEVLAGWGVVFGLLMIRIDVLWRRHQTQLQLGSGL